LADSSERGIRISMRTPCKRNDYINWDEYFMGVASISGLRSKDPNTPVGACIVNKENKIVGIGYSGMPLGCSDNEFPWGRDGDFLETKYPYVCHAELNAILNAVTRDLRGCRIYTTLFPCNECTKAIIQTGIKEVIYLSNKYDDTDIVKASKRMLQETNTQIRQFSSTKHSITISLNG
jgi:dCMP deaminase